jgi:hypothetical protein
MSLGLFLCNTVAIYWDSGVNTGKHEQEHKVSIR